MRFWLTILLALPLCSAPTVWPIKVSANGRYFVDQVGAPWMMVGDTDHALIALVCSSSADSGCASSPTYRGYLTSRKAYGFNAINIFGSNLRDSGHVGAAQDGTKPFTTGSGPSTYGSTLNDSYWSKLDRLISDAASYGLVVLFDPLPAQYYNCTSGCGTGAADMFGGLGSSAVTTLGAAFGTRYKNNPNIIWHIGNDCQSCTLSLQKAFLDGILSTDANHITTFQDNYFRSYTNQVNSGSFASEFTVDYVYSYYETYDYARAAYASSPTAPCFLGEGNYEGGNNTGSLTSVANAFITRMQMWWTMTSGCSGHVWGNESVNHNDGSYPGSLNTTATGEVIYLYSLLQDYAWWNLVPDTGNVVLTSGFGTIGPNNQNLYSATYATAAWITDGSLAVIYTPVGQTLTVNMAKFARPVTAYLYDPSNGTQSTIAGSPFNNSGSQNIVVSGNNHDGSGNTDWVVVLDATKVSSSQSTQVN